MLRLLGIVFVLGSSGWFAAGRILHYYRAVQHLRELHHGIEILKCELNYTLRPLAELYRLAATRLSGPVAQFFRQYAARLAAGEERQEAARRCLAQQRTLELPSDATLCLLELCDGLGRYDLEGENRLLQLAAHRVGAALERAEAEKRPMAKSCAVLALCAGAALVIITI